MQSYLLSRISSSLPARVLEVGTTAVHGLYLSLSLLFELQSYSGTPGFTTPSPEQEVLPLPASRAPCYASLGHPAT